MNVLVIGGTRFFGKHLVWELLGRGHEVTIATRGKTPDPFGSRVKRLTVDRTDAEEMKRVFAYKYYDVVYDDIAYCAGDVRNVMEAIGHRRYVMVSTISVYNELHFQTVESDFVPEREQLIWYGKGDEAGYDALKRSAECALAHQYAARNTVVARFPFVIGEDDYTERLYFYVEHAVRKIPMWVDNLDAQMSFISADDAGKLLAYLGEDEVRGAVNGASRGTVSIREVLSYVEKKTGCAAAISPDAECAPYNGAPNYSINTGRAERIGFHFSSLKDWIYELIDTYIARAQGALE